MKSQNDRLIAKYYHLLDYFLSGSLALTVLRTIRNLYEQKQILQDDIFLTTLLNSTYNTAILSLANTIKPHDDSLHLIHLLNSVKNSKGLFDSETKKLFLEFANKVETSLLTISQTIDRIIEIRDTTVAHLDRGHINNPSSLFQSLPTKWEDFESAYKIVENILFETGKFLGQENSLQDFKPIADLKLVERTLEVMAFLNR